MSALIGNPLLLTSAATEGSFKIERSLRFNNTDNTNLTRTFSTKGDKRIWTVSFWIKIAGPQESSYGSDFWGARYGNNARYISLRIKNDGRIGLYGGAYTTGGSSSVIIDVATRRSFRDYSGWLHCVVSLDTTQSVSTDRVKLWFNGLQETDLGNWGGASNSPTYPSQYDESFIGADLAHFLGCEPNVWADYTLDGYLSDFYYIDGRQLFPAAFGEFDSTGVWTPKAFASPTINDGTNWTSMLTSETGSFYSSSAGDLFDGVLGKGSAGETASASAEDKWLKFTPTGGLKFQNRIRVQHWPGGNSPYKAAKFTLKLTDGTEHILDISSSNGSSDFFTLYEGNGTTWSSNGSVSGNSTQVGKEFSRLFNGNLGEYAEQSGNDVTLTWTPSSAITVKKRMRIYFLVGGDPDDTVINGDATAINVDPHNGWTDVAVPSGGMSFSKLEMKRGGSGVYARASAIEIDGQVLLDASTDNSCHLKFDDTSTNAALGTDSFSNGNWTTSNINALEVDYEGMITGVGNWDDGNVSRFFDGSTSTESEFNSGGGNAVFTPNPAISYSGNLEIYTGRTTAMAVELNDSGTDISYVGSGWTTLDTGGGTLSKMKFKNGSAGNQRFGAIRIDGSILTQVGGDKVDSFVDSPTNYGTDTGAGGEVQGNYCTWNSLHKDTDIDLSQGNLKHTQDADGTVHGTLGASSGKWYFEMLLEAGTSPMVGVSKMKNAIASNVGGTDSYAVMNDGRLFQPSGDGGTESSAFPTWTNGDYIGVALDMDNGKLFFSKNGTFEHSGSSSNPANGTNPVNDVTLTGVWGPCIGNGPAMTAVTNFGQRAFKYAAPSGFKCLCTQNLPDTFSGDDVNDPSKFFDITTYTGTGAALSLKRYKFQPDFLWFKSRSNAGENHLHDALRGPTKLVFSDTTAVEDTDANTLTSFDSNGFTLPADSSGESNNVSGWTWVNWAWDAGSSVASTSNSGSATNYSRWTNATAGFSIIKATISTGSGYHQKTVDHGLGVAPDLILGKGLDAAEDWLVYHSSIGTTGILNLNDDGAVDTSTSWKYTATSNSQFTFDSYGAAQNMIYYTWAGIEGYSKFGAYEGNGAADGTFVYCGFRPRFVLTKNMDGTDNWHIHDTERNPSNVTNYYLFPNKDNGGYSNEGSNDDRRLDILSNGFKLREDNYINSSHTFIYAAFAESPLKTSRAR